MVWHFLADLQHLQWLNCINNLITEEMIANSNSINVLMNLILIKQSS